MPRGDGTGPDGRGEMTGRGLGYCNGFATPGFAKGVPRGGGGFGRRFGNGQGFRRGYGRGFGNRRGYVEQNYDYYPNYPAPRYSANDEKEYLENEIEMLKNELQSMEKRFSELKSEEK